MGEDRMDLARVFDGKKFMWDGKVYNEETERREASQKYLDNGFEVQMVDEDNQYFLFTRRVVTEVVVEG
jgi:hypothetical protein